ncbi:hypothetical protein NQ318_002524 [Aromia moschata]|uniref:Leishmanolysin-like peptidase n=1 Tax=Aromia moschata TaxID=1265417 RepID=A0AAV8Y849_9CUCU|nr:hypothetical protein NQ318_002524 [Aromia moschata]
MMLNVKWKCSSLICFVVIINFFIIKSTCEHRLCNHVYPKHYEILYTKGEPEHNIRKRSIDQSLRILLYYDQSVYRLDEERFKLINNTILPEAVTFWEKALLLRRSETVIRLTRKCSDSQIFVKDGRTHCIDTCNEKTMCGEVEVPDDHLDACRTCNSTGQNCGVVEGSNVGPGIPNFDFVFYISAMQTERCNKSLTVAYAAHCQQESGLDRPIAGHANLCPNSISTKRQELEILLSTVKHEILHALGFSVSLYAFYREPNGKPLTERSPETGKPPLNETSGYMKREVKGAELEDQGEEGTALTHWEKRILEVREVPFIPFCNKVKQDPLQTECTNDRSSVALCNLVKHNFELPKIYQNFDYIQYVESGTEGFYGGSIFLADYCPYIQEFTWRSKNVVVRGSHCQYLENNPKPGKNFALEKYGENSRCFEHTNQMWEERSCRQMRQWRHWGSGCYGYRCQNGRLHLLVENYSYECFHKNQEISIRIISDGWLHKGAIICPPCKEICEEEFAARNETCKLGDESPPSTAYSRDELQCGSFVAKESRFLLLVIVFFCKFYLSIKSLSLIR